MAINDVLFRFFSKEMQNKASTAHVTKNDYPLNTRENLRSTLRQT